MAKKQSQLYQINSGKSATASPVVKTDTLHADGKVSVSLKYFDSKFECFSKWQPRDLKQFTAWLGKVREKSKADITSDTKLCHRHHGEVKRLPAEISRETFVYGLRITDKARVHGIFSGDTFYLIWLDRNHNLIKV